MKKEYEIRTVSTMDAKDFKFKLRENKIDFTLDMDPDTLEWVFKIMADEEDLSVINKKSLGEMAETLLNSIDIGIDKASSGAVKATKRVSPVVMHFIKSICVTTVKCGRVIKQEAKSAYNSGRNELDKK